ncbi:hypothetical protein [Roseivivax sp. CAU 1761]
MEEKSIALFLTEGSSDKEYRVQLKQDGEGGGSSPRTAAAGRR